MEKIKRINAWQIFIIVVLSLLAKELWFTTKDVKQVAYSEFETLLEQGAIEEIFVSETELKAKIKSPQDQYNFISAIRLDSNFAERLRKFGVKYSMIPSSSFLKDLVVWTLPFILMFFLWGYVARKMGGGVQGGMMSVGKSKAKIYVETDTKITFEDVAGVEEAEAELKEIVGFLKDPKKFERLGGRMPKGILLVGPPGTGKTLMAKAVAGEAGVPFFSTNGAEFVEMFVGVGAARVRDLFEQAKQKAPCIIFIDELDALGKARLVSGMQSNDEKEQTLNQLLAELDGFDSRSGIVLLAATNRPEILDPALLRSGRFDRQVIVDRPDKAGRLAILQLHAKKIKLDKQVELAKIADLTPGLTGADLANLLNEASLVAIRRNAEWVTEVDFNEAIERMLAGPEKKNRLINEFERRVVAHHEMGHAIVASALAMTETIHKISIIPRGVRALGYTIQRPTEDRFLMTREELERKMTVLLAGRAAEKIIFQHLSTGAADDLEKTSDIAWALVTNYGMSEKLGDVVYARQTQSFLGNYSDQSSGNRYSDETAREIDCAVREIIHSAAEKAKAVLLLNETLLRSSAKILLERETLSGLDLEAIISQVKKV